jgi:hypothetical protein
MTTYQDVYKKKYESTYIVERIDQQHLHTLQDKLDEYSEQNYSLHSVVSVGTTAVIFFEKKS